MMYTPPQTSTTESQPAECARIGMIENLQRKMKELRERYNEAVKRLGLDNWPVFESRPHTLEETVVRLTYLKSYYLFTCIAQKIEAGWTIPDDEWMNLKKRLEEASKEFHLIEGRWPVYYLAERMEETAYKLLPLASTTIRQIVNERNEVSRLLDKLEEEISGR